MKRRHPAARAWYGSKKTPPEDSLLQQIEATDPEPEHLFDNTSGSPVGEGLEIVKELYDKMDSLKRNPLHFRTWTEEDGVGTFFEALLDLAPANLRLRVQLLQQVGGFKFRTAATPEDKKAQVEAIFAPSAEGEDERNAMRRQTRLLGSIWSPKPDTLLHFIIAQPAQVGRVLADRLSPASIVPLRLIGHPFTEVHSTVLKPLTVGQVVAYERGGEIHLLSGVRSVLEMWDEDAASSGCSQITLFEALLLHEVVEVVLDETQPEMEPLTAHIIASTFERYLKGRMLSVAVEDFFLSWPPMSTAEIEEIRKTEMQQQLEEAKAFFAEEAGPVEEQEDVGNLPVDAPANMPVKKKKKGVKKK